MPIAGAVEWSRTAVAAYVVLCSAGAIGVLGAVAVVTNEPFIFPSLGPTAFMLFYAGMAAATCPRTVITGHLIGVLAALLGLLLFGLIGAAPDLTSVTWTRVGAVTVAVGVTVAMMLTLGSVHGPAVATTLIVALGLIGDPLHLAVLMLSVVGLAVIAFVINRAVGIPVPRWGPVPEVATRDADPGRPADTPPAVY